MLHAEGIHSAVDTAGNVPWSHFEAVLPDTDLFLYDVKCMDPAVHEAYTGVNNARILENLGLLLDSGAAVWIRVPVIPSVNDTHENMAQLRDFLSKHKQPGKIELLPYHSIGISKAHAIGKEQSVFEIPTQAKIEELEQYLLQSTK